MTNTYLLNASFPCTGPCRRASEEKEEKGVTSMGLDTSSTHHYKHQDVAMSLSTQIKKPIEGSWWNIYSLTVSYRLEVESKLSRTHILPTEGGTISVCSRQKTGSVSRQVHHHSLAPQHYTSLKDLGIAETFSLPK